MAQMVKMFHDFSQGRGLEVIKAISGHINILLGLFQG